MDNIFFNCGDYEPQAPVETSGVVNVDLENKTLEDVLDMACQEVILQPITDEEEACVLEFIPKFNTFWDSSQYCKSNKTSSKIVRYPPNKLKGSSIGCDTPLYRFQQHSNMTSQTNMEPFNKSKFSNQNTHLSVGSVQSADKLPSISTEEQPTSPFSGKSGIQCNEGPGIGNTQYDVQHNPPMVKLHEKSKLDNSHQLSVQLHERNKLSKLNQSVVYPENFTPSEGTYPAAETDLKSKKRHSRKPYDNAPAVAVSKSKNKEQEQHSLLTGPSQQNNTEHYCLENLQASILSQNNQTFEKSKKDECPSISSTMENLALEDTPVNQTVGEIALGYYEETVGEYGENSGDLSSMSNYKNSYKDSNQSITTDKNDAYNSTKCGDGRERRVVIDFEQIQVATQQVNNMSGENQQGFINSDEFGQFENNPEIQLNNGQTLMLPSKEQIEQNIRSMQSDIETGHINNQAEHFINDILLKQNNVLLPMKRNNQSLYIPSNHDVCTDNHIPNVQIISGKKSENHDSKIDINSNHFPNECEFNENNAFGLQTNVDLIPNCASDVIIGDANLMKSLGDDDTTNVLKNVDENGMVTISVEEYKALVAKSGSNTTEILDPDEFNIDLLDLDLPEEFLNGLPFGVSEIGMIQTETCNNVKSGKSPGNSDENINTSENILDEIPPPDIPDTPQGQSEYESFAIPLTVEEMATESEEEDKAKKGDTKSKRGVKSKPSKKNDKTRSFQKPLWEFLLDVLADKRHNPSVIKWLDHKKGTFKIVKGKQLANLWTAARNRHNADLKYEFFARAMRHYYSKGILQRMTGKKLQYMFCQTFDWHTYDKQTCANKAQ